MRKLLSCICVLMLSMSLYTPALASSLPVVPEEEWEFQHIKENREFAAIPTIEVTGNRLWAGWMSGGDTEPHDENYSIIAYSDDWGKTWVEPYMILDKGLTGKVICPVFWQDPTGRLWLFYNVSGAWAVYTDNPCDDPEDIVWSEPMNMGRYPITNKPIAIERDGVSTYLICGQNMASYTNVMILSAQEPDFKWQLERGSFAKTKSKNTWFLEGAIVEKLDGTLWVLTRVEQGHNGGVEQAFSTDQSRSWSKLEGDLPYPLQGPGSRFQIRRLQSGNLAWVSHDTTKGRTKLTIWLSEDDGETWPYQLLLDGRSSVSYPDIAQAADGTIYVIYDKGRSKEQEIRMAVFTEEDIKAGAFVTEGAQEKVVVSKTGGYEDIVAIEEPFDQVMTVDNQAAMEALLPTLPATLHVTTETGAVHTLDGRWMLGTVTEGRAKIGYSVVLPEKVQDTFDLLVLEVLWENQKE